MSLFTIRTLIDYVYSDATYDWVESELSFRAGRCPHTQEKVWSYESTNSWLKEGMGNNTLKTFQPNSPYVFNTILVLPNLLGIAFVVQQNVECFKQ